MHSTSFFFFFNDTATTEIYTLSLHDALPIWWRRDAAARHGWQDTYALDSALLCCRLTDRAEAAGDPRAGARPLDEQSVPARAQHSVTSKAVTARQLQALVRRPGASTVSQSTTVSQYGTSRDKSRSPEPR